ncbi:transcriptional regulator of NAD metabolism [Bacillus mesophilus]|uniref:Transcription repressor NadR n=1 Tax=Bacillus mesophilus TaxID=1808955 RepID=A0A6M0Q5X8_9BACI|nr:transcription repressor NadR [Bacillus mesophilus]MBM7660671.1 transcriptional regulator of NAD metabolism [Bacillus mesophilus]NEY71781.1 transcription repressor NadR [Bacillus mesophilus]
MKKKLLGEERRTLLLQWLKTAETPLTGSDLADRSNVSRQVIVQDISLLKAKNEPIVATSEGYIYLTSSQDQILFQEVIVCKHTPAETKEELCMIVDHGVSVKDVRIEHPVYGDLSASVRVSNRIEVDQFLAKLKHTNAPLLSQLTDGLHLHTLEADSMEKIKNACQSLKDRGFLIEA